MTLDAALRASEILLALAFLQHSAEHIVHRVERLLFAPRAVASLALLFGVFSPWMLLFLTLHSILVLHRFQGPYNGGSDRMGLLILYCLCAANWVPQGHLQEAALGYLGVQVILSYFISGKVKLVNPDWRSGQALRDVFAFSAYPVSEGLRDLAHKPRLLWGASWLVIIAEVAFPLAFLNGTVLVGALVITGAFHVANACLFGLNRFVWVWIAAYPSLIWLEARLMQGV